MVEFLWVEPPSKENKLSLGPVKHQWMKGVLSSFHSKIEANFLDVC